MCIATNKTDKSVLIFNMVWLVNL